MPAAGDGIKTFRLRRDVIQLLALLKGDGFVLLAMYNQHRNGELRNQARGI